MTVEADLVLVEARLVSGQLACPGCGGSLRPWGWARARRVRGVVGVLRPRRARCVGCLLTHVLLPVTVLLRRAYAADVIGVAVTARAAGVGHRGAGAGSGVPVATVRGWLRRLATRLESVRVFVLQVAVRAGVDVVVPTALGCPWRDLLAALGVAAAALRGRFGPVGVLGPVTAWQVAVACSAGRLLAPGWPPLGGAVTATRVASDGRRC